MSDTSKDLPPATEQRGRTRESDHLRAIDATVELISANRQTTAVLVDESISGVGAIIEGEAPFDLDECLQVRRGEYERDAVVQRRWIDEEGRTCLGLQWRTSLDG